MFINSRYAFRGGFTGFSVSTFLRNHILGKLGWSSLAQKAIKAKGIRFIQFAAFAKQRMLRLIRLKIKNKMKGHCLILILLSFLLGKCWEERG